jgi:dTDP-4-dehydrorhamnose 3,5-epimerase-like enzyme
VKLRVLAHPRITTRGPSGEENGFLVPLYNRYEGFVPEEHRPEQVYLTVCRPGARKGPHLHMKRWGYFTCIRGNVRIVARLADGYAAALTGEAHGFATIEVPAGVPAIIENVGDVDAYVVNTPSPAWRPDDQDDHEVTGWDVPPSLG